MIGVPVRGFHLHAFMPSSNGCRAARPDTRLLLALALVAWACPLQAAPVTDRIVAVVNSELITLSDLKTQTEAQEAKLRAQYRGAELDRRLRQTEFEALNRLIESKLQLQHAKKKGSEATDEEVASAIKEMRRQGEKIDEKNPVAMKMVKDQLTLMKVVDREVRGGLMVSEIELQRYYMQHQSRFLLPDEYTISQILIVPRRGEDRAQARERAAAAYAELQKGGDFAETALRLSDGQEATKGGHLGTVLQGELLPQLERAMPTLEIGKYTEPIETPIGLHIIRLEEKSPTGFRPFAEVRNEIQGLVYRQKSEDGFQSWLAELKNKAYIEVKF